MYPMCYLSGQPRGSPDLVDSPGTRYSNSWLFVRWSGGLDAIGFGFKLGGVGAGPVRFVVVAGGAGGLDLGNISGSAWWRLIAPW